MIIIFVCNFKKSVSVGRSSSTAGHIPLVPKQNCAGEEHTGMLINGIACVKL